MSSGHGEAKTTDISKSCGILRAVWVLSNEVINRDKILGIKHEESF
jgi:hypothetical protein